jgi:hypothetical protein
MVKIQLTHRQVLEYIILGIKNGQYQAAINLAQDCIDELDVQSKTNQSLDSDGKKPSQVS